MRRGLMVALAGAALLAGCDKAPEQPVERDNDIVEAPATRAEAPPEREAEPARKAEPTAGISNVLPEDEAVSADEQMQEDADATGLTARAPSPDAARDEPADPVGDLISSNGLGT